MHSLRTKTTLLTVCAIIVAMTVATVLGAIAIRNIGNSSADQILLLLCETGEKNLDGYFGSVEKSVEMVSSYAHADLEGLKPEALGQHVDRVKAMFRRIAYMTNGVLTYYYRLDPAVSGAVKGFWYVNLDGDDFVPHEVTDITLYDVEDTTKLVWFTVPRATGEAIWLPPYITDNLDVRVISYNVPIYWNQTFVGVVGIEIDYSTMADQVNNISLYDNGYAFLCDTAGNLIYHPKIDVTMLADVDMPRAPEGLISESATISYRYEGVEKRAVWLPLNNGMRLYVTVPVAEINRNWQQLVCEIVFVSMALLVVFILVTLRFTGQITRPLRALTRAAEQVDAGNYDFTLQYDGDDEIGLLTRTFRDLVDHLKVYIQDLSDLAYADALTSVRNKGAYDIFVRKLHTKLIDAEEPTAFAIGMFDCDDLKQINDQYGHDKGDIYLKTASHLICRVFHRSPVFRVGGDEFAVILQNDDYDNREALAREFEAKSAESAAAGEPWTRVSVAMGIAVFDPQRDNSVEDVSRRADQLMYNDKNRRKAGKDIR